MNLKKKLLALGLALSLTVSLAACGAKEEAPAVKEEPKQEEVTVVPEETPAEVPAEEPVTMRVAAMTGPTGMGLAKLLDTFGVVETMQAEPLVTEKSANGGRYNFLLD